eukprot:scaffold18694_cov66-Skeletonema_dohrnii-CCMP3373.AAC.2
MDSGFSGFFDHQKSVNFGGLRLLRGDFETPSLILQSRSMYQARTLPACHACSNFSDAIAEKDGRMKLPTFEWRQV